MILGIGIDIVHVERIKKAIERYGKRFIDRVFTEKEQAYCNEKANPFESYAARFAVKEAVFKALGKGWDECGGFTSVEIINNDLGRPDIVFNDKAGKYTEIITSASVFVSITHDAGVTAAVVVLESG